MQDLEHSFSIEDQRVSARLQRPEAARWLLVLGHGAGSSREHATMDAIADAMLSHHVAVYRYNFPWSERGSRRIDPRPVILQTVRAAIARVAEAAPDLPLFAGGHSFGGRMTSTAQSQQGIDGLQGLVFCSFPLHPAGKPSTDRAKHLEKIAVPLLFLSGTRDRLAQAELLTDVCEGLPQAALHWLDTADHGYRVLKRRESQETVFDEMARVTQQWLNGIQGAKA